MSADTEPSERDHPDRDAAGPGADLATQSSSPSISSADTT